MVHSRRETQQKACFTDEKKENFINIKRFSKVCRDKTYRRGKGLFLSLPKKDGGVKNGRKSSKSWRKERRRLSLLCRQGRRCVTCKDGTRRPQINYFFIFIIFFFSNSTKTIYTNDVGKL